MAVEEPTDVGDALSRTPTPEHYPKYGVHLNQSQISAIISSSLPRHSLKESQLLHSGGSFNNRIYLLELVVCAPHAKLSGLKYFQDETLEVVLKVAGRFAGKAELHNEVGSLLMLETYCPQIPSPRVLAWSCHEFGHCAVLRNDNIHEKSVSLLDDTLSHIVTKNWILMTRRPGRPLTSEDVTGPHASSIVTALARYMADWRSRMPTPAVFGNLTLHLADIPTTSKDIAIADNLTARVGHLILCKTQPLAPPGNLRQYYESRLGDALKELEENNALIPNRLYVSTLVSDFMLKTLPRLSLFTPQSGRGDAASIKFTHFDLSPRNILISPQSLAGDSIALSERANTETPVISGIVDFEYSGFFPATEEFTNNAVDNEGDWPDDVSDTLLESLERLGVPTPSDGINAITWRQACCLTKLIGNISPWEILQMPDAKDPKIASKLIDAAAEVADAVSQLQTFVEDSDLR